jgi:hypothetical protein
MTLHMGDTVEVVATKRQGIIADGPPSRFGVRFSDEIKPSYAIYLNEAELALVSCPHEEQGGSKFVLTRGIMGGSNDAPRSREREKQGAKTLPSSGRVATTREDLKVEP